MFPRNPIHAQLVPNRWAAALLPGLTDFAIVFPVLFMLLKMQGVSTLLGDGDTGWHIRTGEWILAHGRVPTTDIFSFSMPGQPWFAWEWAWDVCFAWLHRLAGLPGVVFVNILLLSVISLLLFRLVQRECGNPLAAILVTTFALAGTSLHWLARPHLVTWLFILVFSHILTRALSGRTRLLTLLPVLTLFWTNLHGGFFVGIALVFVYAVGAYLNKQTASQPFWFAAAACLLASFANPYGWHLHQHVVTYLLDSKQVENILEFQSINFRHPLARYFELFLAFGILAAVQAISQRRIVPAILIFAWAHLALVSIRNIPVFLLFAAPEVARWIAGALNRLPRLTAISANFLAIERLPRLHLGSAALFALLLLFMAHPPAEASALLRSQYNPKNYPDRAIETLESWNAARVFTDDEWGDYVIYRMYPRATVFVDGRSDFYGAAFESRYLELMNVHFDWERGLAQYGVDTVLLRADAALAGAMKQSPHWRVAYDDGIALIFLRQSGASAPLFAGNHFSPESPVRGIRP